MKNLKKIFDPSKKISLNEAAFNLKKEDNLKYSSELGLMMALDDSKQSKEKLFMLKNNIKLKPILTNFKKYKK